MLLQNIHIITIIIPLLMGFFSFVIKDKHEYVINRIYYFLFLLFFFYVLYGVFEFNLIDGNEYKIVVGGWKKAMGIELKYNLKCALATLSSIFVLLVLFANNLKNEMSYAFRGFSCIMLCGVNGMIATNDIFNSYVFFEIICITTYIIYSHGENKTCLKNAYNYMILSGFSSVVFLLVACLLYQITSNLNIDIINQSIEPFAKSKAVSAIFVLFVCAMMFKIGFYPFHNILFEIYKNLSIKYLIVVAGLSSIIYPFFILKFTTTLFGEEVILNNEYLNISLKIFGVIGFIFFNAMAISVVDVLSFVISLSFAQTTLFAFCLPYVFDKQISNGLLFALSSHSLIKVCILSILYQIQKQTKILKIKKTDISFISSKTYKYLLVLLLFLLSGMPFSLVFMSKWYILSGLFNSYGNMFWLSMIIVGFAMDIFACFMLIKKILVKNDSLKTEVKNNYFVVGNVIFIILFLVVSSFFVGKFNY